MKPLLLTLLIIGALQGKRQDCYSPDNLITISGQVGMYKQALIPQIKLGVWRNVHSSGATFSSATVIAPLLNTQPTKTTIQATRSMYQHHLPK